LIAYNWALFQLQKQAPEASGKPLRCPRQPRSELAKQAAVDLIQALGIPVTDSVDLNGESIREWIRNRHQDVDWLRAQVLLRLAESLRSEVHPTPRATINRARLIEEARGLLSEEKHGLQYRREGLFWQLAEAYLRTADLPEAFHPREEGKRLSREDLLKKALASAEKAVAWNPMGASELLVLGQVYAALSDWQQATEQWEKMLSLEPAPETWSAIASACFPEEAARPSYHPKSGEERERLHRFLREALSIVESEPLSDGFDEDQIKAHAGLHFCLGKSYLFDKNYDNAETHLTIALGLGYRKDEALEALAEVSLGKRPVAA
jgi:tetratricopeptide (TPR) repeat protein